MCKQQLGLNTGAPGVRHAISPQHHHAADGTAKDKNWDAVAQSEEQIAAEFNGTCKRLPAARAAYIYWRAGGLVFGVFAFFLFMATQTCRIYSDLWIR